MANVNTVVFYFLGEAEKFSQILKMSLEAEKQAFGVPMLSQYKSSRSGVWMLGGEPQPRLCGEDGTNQPPLPGSGRMRREEDDTDHLEVWA